MTNKRKYWLTKAIHSLHEAYDHLGEVTGLVPSNENFDATIDQYQASIDNICTELEELKDIQS